MCFIIMCLKTIPLGLWFYNDFFPTSLIFKTWGELEFGVFVHNSKGKDCKILFLDRAVPLFLFLNHSKKICKTKYANRTNQYCVYHRYSFLPPRLPLESSRSCAEQVGLSEQDL